MKSLYIISLIIISTIVHGQDNSTSPTKAEQDRLMIGINYSADIGYRTLKSSNNEGKSSSIIDSRNAIEKPSFGFTTGLNIRYKLSQHFDIEIGIQYAQKGYSEERKSFIYSDPVHPLFGGSSNSSANPSSIKQDYNYHYFDIPVRVIYSLGKNKFQFLTSIGFASNILINVSQTTIVEYSDNTESTSRDITNVFNKLNISPMLSLGVSYSISPKIKFQIEPTFRYSILKTVDSSITEDLWNAGVNVACYYTL